MPAPDILISNKGAEPSPNSYTLKPSESFMPVAVTALFNGASAGGAFLACLTLRSQDDLILARTFPATPINAGDSAVVTYAPNLLDEGAFAAGSGLAFTKRVISAATTNATVVKAAPGAVVGWAFGNENVASRYVKFYNKATSPTVGTDVPQVTFRIPGGASANVGFDTPIEFDTGIGLALTTGVADSDTGAVAANEISVNVFYV